MPNGLLIRQQVSYASSPLALTSSSRIIAIKITNSQRLLGRYRHPLLLEKLNRLSRLRSRTQSVKNKTTLFNTEALAAREYWEMFGLLCHQSPDWKRVHPHATDTLNILLNSGYVILARQCLNAITGTGLLPEIGLLHGDNSNKPLVYDLMEVFRQIAVDSIILPSFSRHRASEIERGGLTFRKTMALLNTRYQKFYWYKRRCERLTNIIKLETIHLRQAISRNEIWQPYQHLWSRHHVCRE